MKLMKFVALLAFAGSSQAITIDQANNQLVEASTAVLSLSFTDRMMNDTEKYPDGLRWNHTPSEIKELGTEIITEFNAGLTKLINVKGPRTFKNTIEPFNKFESALNTKSTPIQFYTQVSDKKEVREAAKVFEK
jgi:Zn-dependent oligopeptidase